MNHNSKNIFKITVSLVGIIILGYVILTNGILTKQKHEQDQETSNYKRSASDTINADTTSEQRNHLKSYNNTNISFRYPADLQKQAALINDTTGWSYEHTKKGKLIVKLVLTDSFKTNTNLSEATFTVGKSSNKKVVEHCMNSTHGIARKSGKLKRKGIKFAKRFYQEAGTGNYYQVKQFSTIHKNACYTIEQMVHTVNIHNYPPERNITKFDSFRVWKLLDIPWNSFRFAE